MSVIIPLHQHPNASECSTVAMWEDPTSLDAVFAAGTGFIASIGRTGTVFIDLFTTKETAIAALVRYRSPGYSPLPE
jgi:hypothetical protein